MDGYHQNVIQLMVHLDLFIDFLLLSSMSTPPLLLIHNSPLKAAALKHKTHKSYNQHLISFLSFANITVTVGL